MATCDLRRLTCASPATVGTALSLLCCDTGGPALLEPLVSPSYYPVLLLLASPGWERLGR